MSRGEGGGRPRKPTSLHVLQGTVRKHRQNKGEPKPEPAGGTPPKWLASEGRKVWRELAPIAQRMGVLSEADVEAFALMCAQLAIARREQSIGGSKALVEAMKIAARFGFTPSDRAKITIKPKESDPFTDFLEKKA